MADATTALNRATADIPLTRDAHDDLQRAAGAASSRGDAEANPVDVLRAVLANHESLANATLRNLGADPAAVAGGLPVNGVAPALPLRQLLVNANREAQVLGHYQVDSIHLLLALLYSDSPVTAAALQKAGLTMYDLRRHLQTGARADAPVAVRPAGTRAPDRALRRKPWPRLRGVLGASPLFLAILAVVAVDGILLWVNVLPGAVAILTLVFVVAGWIAAVCVHEFCHALVAYLGGDLSMPRAGYLTLDPLRYTNLLMSIVFPVVFLLLGGLALPGGAVYINHSALRSKWWDSAVSLAGPVGTLLCGILLALVYAGSYLLGLVTNSNANFFEAISLLGYYQMYAFILNLIPVPPLDGFGILRPWLPYSVQAAALRIGWYGLFFLFAAIWYVPGFNAFFSNLGEQLAMMFGLDPYLIFLGSQHFRLH